MIKNEDRIAFCALLDLFRAAQPERQIELLEALEWHPNWWSALAWKAIFAKEWAEASQPGRERLARLLMKKVEGGSPLEFMELAEVFRLLGKTAEQGSTLFRAFQAMPGRDKINCLHKAAALDDPGIDVETLARLLAHGFRHEAMDNAGLAEFTDDLKGRLVFFSDEEAHFKLRALIGQAESLLLSPQTEEAASILF